MTTPPSYKGESCYTCGRGIHYSDKFGVFAYRHNYSESEFCNDYPNSTHRASPDGFETR